MNAILAVIGQDQTGILAKIAVVCTECNANIIDVNQTVMQDYFAMLMLTEIDSLNCDFNDFSAKVHKAGEEVGMSVHVMHEDIFNSMHRI